MSENGALCLCVIISLYSDQYATNPQLRTNLFIPGLLNFFARGGEDLDQHFLFAEFLIQRIARHIDQCHKHELVTPLIRGVLSCCAFQ